MTTNSANFKQTRIMPAGELYIRTANTVSPQSTDPYVKDGYVDAYTAFGLSMEDEGLGRLIAPIPHKEPVVNKNVTAHGAMVIESSCGLHDEQTISIPVHITAPSRAAFWTRYAAFCSTIDSDYIHVKTCYTGNKEFKCRYLACQNFSEFMQQMAKFDLVLYLPNTPEPNNSNSQQ